MTNSINKAPTTSYSWVVPPPPTTNLVVKCIHLALEAYKIETMSATDYCHRSWMIQTSRPANAAPKEFMQRCTRDCQQYKGFTEATF